MQQNLEKTLYTTNKILHNKLNLNAVDKGIYEYVTNKVFRRIDDISWNQCMVVIYDECRRTIENDK